MSRTPRRPAVFSSAAVAALLAITASGCGLLDPDGDQPPPSTIATTVEPSTTTTTAPPKDLAQEPAPEPLPPAQPLDVEGIGELGLGFSVEEAMASGIVGDLGPGCEAQGTEYLPLKMEDVSGFLVIRNDRVDAIVLQAGRILDGGTIGQQRDIFTLLSWNRYGISLDKSREAELGTWLATMTDKTNGLALHLEIDPTTDSVMTAATPYLPHC